MEQCLKTAERKELSTPNSISSENILQDKRLSHELKFKEIFTGDRPPLKELLKEILQKEGKLYRRK